MCVHKYFRSKLKNNNFSSKFLADISRNFFPQMLPHRPNEGRPRANNQRLISLTQELIRDMLEHPNEYHSTCYEEAVGDGVPPDVPVPAPFSVRAYPTAELQRIDDGRPEVATENASGNAENLGTDELMSNADSPMAGISTRKDGGNQAEVKPPITPKPSGNEVNSKPFIIGVSNNASRGTTKAMCSYFSGRRNQSKDMQNRGTGNVQNCQNSHVKTAMESIKAIAKSADESKKIIRSKSENPSKLRKPTSVNFTENPKTGLIKIVRQEAVKIRNKSSYTIPASDAAMLRELSASLRAKLKELEPLLLEKRNACLNDPEVLKAEATRMVEDLNKLFAEASAKGVIRSLKNEADKSSSKAGGKQEVTKFKEPKLPAKSSCSQLMRLETRLNNIQAGIQNLQFMIPNISEKADYIIEQNEKLMCEIKAHDESRKQEMIQQEPCDIADESLQVIAKKSATLEEIVPECCQLTFTRDTSRKEESRNQGLEHYFSMRLRHVNITTMPRSLTSLSLNRKKQYNDGFKCTNAFYEPTEEDKKRELEAASYLKSTSRRVNQ